MAEIATIAPRFDHANQLTNWAAVNADPRFRDLHRRKSRFLWGLMAFSVAYYFLLPLGAAYFQDLFKIKVWGPLNVGLLFALSEFLVAWAIASSLHATLRVAPARKPWIWSS